MAKTPSQVRAADYGLPLYFDLQAKMGHTKHIGGEAATRRLAELCHLVPGEVTLNVGAGSGIAATYLAENYGVQVVGVDILSGMVDSARKWVQEKGLQDRIQFHLGDAQELPFEDAKFDAVICESVNVFLPDKEKAVREYVRVTKPGGYIGLTEAIWIKKPSKEVSEVIIEATGQPFLPSEVWENLLEKAGLVDLVFEHHATKMREEARNQTGLMRLGDYIRILGRAIRILLTDRETRSLIKYMAFNPKRYFDDMGYGIYAGKLPE